MLAKYIDLDGCLACGFLNDSRVGVVDVVLRRGSVEETGIPLYKPALPLRPKTRQLALRTQPNTINYPQYYPIGNQKKP